MRVNRSGVMGESARVDRRGERGRRLGTFLLVVVLLMFGALGGRLVFIQRELRGKLVAYAQDQQEAEIPIPARRGMILDRTGRLLAGSQESGSCFADMILLGADRAAWAAAKLGPILDMDSEALTERLLARTGRGTVWGKRRLAETGGAAVRSPRRHCKRGKTATSGLKRTGSVTRGSFPCLVGVLRRSDFGVGSHLACRECRFAVLQFHRGGF